jgi:hypothetical protein
MGTKTCGGRAAEDKTYIIQRIYTCLLYTSLEATFYLDR